MGNPKFPALFQLMEVLPNWGGGGNKNPTTKPTIPVLNSRLTALELVCMKKKEVVWEEEGRGKEIT